MKLKPLIFLMALAILPVIPTVLPATAQSDSSAIARPSAPPRHARRIEINPRPVLYRRCVDWYELQNRPSGTVLYPQKRCWWVRG